MNKNELAPPLVYEEERAPASRPATLGKEETLAIPTALKQSATTYASRGILTGAIAVPKKEVTTFAPRIKKSLDKEWWGLRHAYKAMVNLIPALWDVIAFGTRVGMEGARNTKDPNKKIAMGTSYALIAYASYSIRGIVPAVVFGHRILTGRKIAPKSYSWLVDDWPHSANGH
jgi:hypothetical protein